MHMHAEKLIFHQRTDRCKRATEMRRQRHDVELVQRAGEMKFSIYGRDDKPLIEGMKKFQYLGSMLKHTYNDWPAVHRNIGKAREVWKRLGKLLRLEGADIQMSALLYKEIIQAVMMFG